jgi:uncharacterized membrane protein YphA (DoxX/SURF4 family)
MGQITGRVPGYLRREDGAARAMATPSEQAFWILRAGFTVAPIVAGIDKFTHALVNWDQYLAPWIVNLLGGAANGHTFMLVVGVIEIIAGIGVAVMPRVFGWVVGFWLLGIVFNLLTYPGWYDIALRDFGLSLGAFALARLGAQHERERVALNEETRVQGVA